MENPKNDAKPKLGPAQRSFSEVGKGNLKSAVHGVFAKVQSKTGLKDDKIDEFQEKWLAIPENRTKYKHLVDASTIMAEELFAMFNDIIDFVQAQEGGKSHIFAALRKEGETVCKDPEGFLKHKFDQGKTLFENGARMAKGMMGKKGESQETEENSDEEEVSDFEKAEMEDAEGADEKKAKKTVKTQNLASKPKSKPATTKKKKS